MPKLDMYYKEFWVKTLLTQISDIFVRTIKKKCCYNVCLKVTMKSITSQSQMSPAKCWLRQLRWKLTNGIAGASENLNLYNATTIRFNNNKLKRQSTPTKDHSVKWTDCRAAAQQISSIIFHNFQYTIYVHMHISMHVRVYMNFSWK